MVFTVSCDKKYEAHVVDSRLAICSSDWLDGAAMHVLGPSGQVKQAIEERQRDT